MVKSNQRQDVKHSPRKKKVLFWIFATDGIVVITWLILNQFHLYMDRWFILRSALIGLLAECWLQVVALQCKHESGIELPIEFSITVSSIRFVWQTGTSIVNRDKKQEERDGGMTCNIKSRWNQSRNVQTVLMSQVKSSRFIFQKNRHTVVLKSPNWELLFLLWYSNDLSLQIRHEWQSSTSPAPNCSTNSDSWFIASGHQNKRVELVRMRVSNIKKKSVRAKQWAAACGWCLLGESAKNWLKSSELKTHHCQSPGDINNVLAPLWLFIIAGLAITGSLPLANKKPRASALP